MYLSGYNRSIILPHLAQRQVAQRQVWPGVQEVSGARGGGHPIVRFFMAKGRDDCTTTRCLSLSWLGPGGQGQAGEAGIVQPDITARYYRHMHLSQRHEPSQWRGPSDRAMFG